MNINLTVRQWLIVVALVFVAGVVGGYITLRAANYYRDQAAFADYPARPEALLLRARIFYGLFVIFLLALIAGLGIVVFQVLQVVRPPDVDPTPAATSTVTASPPPPSNTPAAASITATPVPTSQPSAFSASVSAESRFIMPNALRLERVC